MIVSTAPLPADPVVPQEVLDLAAQPLFRGEYRATERESWRDGLPLVGTKVASTRGVAFSNDFNMLRTDAPMVGYAAASYQDAVRAARDLAYDWSDPALGGRIYSSVAVAVLQASDGNYFMALVGSGDPRTSSSELGYRSDRFDSDIYGTPKIATDARATTAWSKPTDKHGTPVDLPAPADDQAVSHRRVQDIAIDRFVPATPMLKAIVDVTELHEIG